MPPCALRQRPTQSLAFACSRVVAMGLLPFTVTLSWMLLAQSVPRCFFNASPLGRDVMSAQICASERMSMEELLLGLVGLLCMHPALCAQLHPGRGQTPLPAFASALRATAPAAVRGVCCRLEARMHCPGTARKAEGACCTGGMRGASPCGIGWCPRRRVYIPLRQPAGEMREGSNASDDVQSGCGLDAAAGRDCT